MHSENLFDLEKSLRFFKLAICLEGVLDNFKSRHSKLQNQRSIREKKKLERAANSWLKEVLKKRFEIYV